MECDPTRSIAENGYFANSTIYRINEYGSSTFPNQSNNIINTFFTNADYQDFWTGINLSKASEPTR